MALTAIAEIMLPADMKEDQLNNMKDNIEGFLASTSFTISRQSKRKTVTRDIRPFVEWLEINIPEKKVVMTLRHAQHGSARPVDLMEHVLCLSPEEIKRVLLVKTATILA